MALKGLGNAGEALTEGEIPMLIEKCFQESRNEYETRVAAVDTFRSEHISYTLIPYTDEISDFHDTKESTWVILLSGETSGI